MCIDVGANVGLTTMVMSQFYEKVYSFEPVPSTFSLLQKNVEKNKLGNVQIFNVGLGAEEKETEITFVTNNRSGGYVNDKAGVAYDGYQSEAVKISTGDSFQINPSFIKIDTEGYELSVMKGLSGTIQNNKPVVMFEVNHWCLNALRGICLPDFIDQVKTIFPVLFAVHRSHYLNLYDENDLYIFMHENIVSNRFFNAVGGFDLAQFDRLMKSFTRWVWDL